MGGKRDAPAFLHYRRAPAGVFSRSGRLGRGFNGNGNDVQVRFPERLFIFQHVRQTWQAEREKCVLPSREHQINRQPGLYAGYENRSLGARQPHRKTVLLRRSNSCEPDLSQRGDYYHQRAIGERPALNMAQLLSRAPRALLPATILVQNFLIFLLLQHASFSPV